MLSTYPSSGRCSLIYFLDSLHPTSENPELGRLSSTKEIEETKRTQYLNGCFPVAPFTHYLVRRLCETGGRAHAYDNLTLHVFDGKTRVLLL